MDINIFNKTTRKTIEIVSQFFPDSTNSFIRNIINYNIKLGCDNYDRNITCVADAFNWENTQEGSNYWMNISLDFYNARNQ